MAGEGYDDPWILAGYVIAGLIVGFFLRHLLTIGVWLIVGDGNVPPVLDSFLIPLALIASQVACGLLGLWVGLRRTRRTKK